MRTLLGRALGIGVIAVLGAVVVLVPVQAQELEETPADAAQETPVPEPGTRVYLEVEAPTGEPVDSGDTFFVHILVEDVERLSGFDFQLSYDPARIEPIEVDRDQAEDTPADGTPIAGGEIEVTEGNIRVEGDVGRVLDGSPRTPICQGPWIRPTGEPAVFGGCAGLGPPVCLDGPMGVDGSGRLATVEFRSRGGEMTEISLAQTTLAADDVPPPCDPDDVENFAPVRIDHTQGPAVTVLLTGGDGLGILLIAGIVIAAVVVIGAGLGGFLLYQRRSSGTPSAS